VIHQQVSVVSQCSLNAWLSGWLAEISADIREALATMRYTNPRTLLLLYFLLTVTASYTHQHEYLHLSTFTTLRFYRATRMHSANYAVARCLSVCLSVCLSHAGILSKRLYVSSKFFSPSGSPTILVFPHQTGWQYSDRNPLTRACKGYEKIAIFDHYLALTRK